MAVSEWRISWDIEHAILPIADILSVSISWSDADRCGSFRRSKSTPLSNIRRLPRSELSVFSGCVLTGSPCDLETDRMTGACDFECMVPGRAAYHRSSSGVDRFF